MATSTTTRTPSLRVVTMRVESADLLIDNESKYVSVGPGIVFHVSFFRDATSDGVKRALRKLLRLPLLSRGMWGDDHAPESILDLCCPPAEGGGGDATGLRLPDILIVPQANLIGKPSSRAGTIRYDDQAEKDSARELYGELCKDILTVAREALSGPTVRTAKDERQELAAKQARNARHPRDMFQTCEFEGLYSAYDARGVPTHDANGEPLAKSALKKCEKLYKARLAKYEKALARRDQHGGSEIGDDAGGNSSRVTMGSDQTAINRPSADTPPKIPGGEDIDASLPLPRVVCGVFGNRQGFRCISSGPTIHSLDL